MNTPTTETVHQVVIRFAGDSGDGMQLTGTQFSLTSALVGNDLSTFNDFPAEIRAPAGTLYGVSGFQLCFGDQTVYTPGDEVDALVAMNPASLKVSLGGVKVGGLIIVNEDTFTPRGLSLASFETNPLEDNSLDGYRLVRVPLGKLCTETVKDLGLNAKAAGRSKNMFALGIMYWVYGRPLAPTINFLQQKFASKPDVLEANVRLLKAGRNWAETAELFSSTYEVKPAPQPSGTYRSISGTQAAAWGVIAAGVKSGLSMFLGSYPITPASDFLHELSRHKNFGVKTFQAEDEIAAVCAAIGASWGGALGVTSTSGPGLALKAEAVGLAVMTELPLVILNVQRGGPSTGLPTKTEQSDLLQCMHGRNGESPVAVVAISDPDDAFETAFEACRLAIEYRHPVVLLSDGYIANGTGPWRIPNPDDLPTIDPSFAGPTSEDEVFMPYRRDPSTLARAWSPPGTPGNEHRIGGLEKQDVTGNVSYDPENHQKMVALREMKVAGMAKTISEQHVDGDPEGDVLLIGWGGTRGALSGALIKLRERGIRVGHAHLRHINPFPQNLEDILWKYKRVICPELNSGQLAALLRSRFLVPVKTLSKVQGMPFTIAEIENEVLSLMEMAQ